MDNPEAYQNITIYPFDHLGKRVESVALRYKVKTQSKSISQTEKTCKDLISRVDLLMEKMNTLRNK